MMFGINPFSSATAKKIVRGTVGVELGVWKGNTSAIFLKKAKHLHLVDTWSIQPYQVNEETWDRYINRYKEQVGGDTPEDFQRYYDDVHNSVVERFSSSDVTIHRKSTRDFFADFNEKVDWIYVDAAHDEEGVYLDLVDSYNYLKQCGGKVIYGDDYGNKPGVTAGVNKFAKEYNIAVDNFYQNQYEIKL